MVELELLGRNDWEDFLSAPLAVLVLGKNGCAACEQWALDLQQWLDSGQAPDGARFGKLILDTPGLGRFKIAHPWVQKLMSYHLMRYMLMVKESKNGLVEISLV